MASLGSDLGKDLKNMYKHIKKAVSKFFDNIKENNEGEGCSKFRGCGGNKPPFGMGYPPFIKPRSPWMILFYPKCCVGIILLITLLLCGVSFYGLVIIILLAIIFIII